MLPVLYSFRRCPYAIRARLALHASKTPYELREVELRNKPISMLEASPKGSVPVLVLPDGQVIDESWDIMRWALQQHDPENWLDRDHRKLDEAIELVSFNDTRFKIALDHYKYAERHPEYPQTYYRTQGELFPQQLEKRLQATPYLLGDCFSIADAAVFPFIRQFAGVDPGWFAQSPYTRLHAWMESLNQSDMFTAVMQKNPVWKAEDTPLVISGGVS